MGELHLEIIVDRLVREFKVEANVGRPQVAYRETITHEAEGEGKYIRQTGGRGQYGHVVLRVGPMPSGKGVIFEDATVGGAIPREYIPSVEKRRARVAGARRAGRLPDDRRPGHADRRQLPRGRFERDGLPDRRLDGRPGGGARAPAPSCWSR